MTHSAVQGGLNPAMCCMKEGKTGNNNTRVHIIPFRSLLLSLSNTDFYYGLPLSSLWSFTHRQKMQLQFISCSTLPGLLVNHRKHKVRYETNVLFSVMLLSLFLIWTPDKVQMQIRSRFALFTRSTQQEIARVRRVFTYWRYSVGVGARVERAGVVNSWVSCC